MPDCDACRYPDVGKVLHTERKTWRMLRTEGTLIRAAG
jgi:hypothetical protein